jgi:hypothetical protein
MRDVRYLDPRFAGVDLEIREGFLFDQMPRRQEVEVSGRPAIDIAHRSGILARSPEEKESGNQQAGRHYQ